MSQEEVSQDQETQSDENLDTLLSEYESGSKTEKNEPKNDYSELQRRLDALEDEKRQESARKAVDEAISTVKEIGEFDLSDLAIEGYLQAMAARDQKIVQAFQDRQKNPDGYKAALEKVAQTIKDDFKYDPKATSDAEAVRAAVKSQDKATDDGPTPQQIAAMTDAEFERYKAGL